MNRISLLLMIVFSSSILLAQKSIMLVDGSIINGFSNNRPSCIVDETDTSVTVTYKFQYVNLLADSLYSSTVMPRISGFGYEHTPSRPEVLMKWDAICLPKNCMGRICVIDSAYTDIPIELSPARKMLFCGEVYTKANVPAIAPFKGFFPSYIVPSSEQNDYRGIPVMNVCVCPIKYNYETKTARIYSMIKYQVKWTNSREPKQLSSAEKNNSSAKFLSNLICNTINIQGFRQQDSLSTEDYLIVTAPKYQSAVERFANWKRMLGYRVEVLYQNGWNAANIKSYIQQFESNHSNLCYVLFFGGLSDVSSFQYSNGTYVSDYEYSCVNNATFPDIYRGRLLVSSLEEAEMLVNKIINYERNPVVNSSFYNTGINSAVFEGDDNGYESTRAILTSELIKKVLSDSLQKEINSVYLRASSAYPAHWNSILSYGNELPESVLQSLNWNGTAKEMMDYINNGAFYTLYIGHGEWNRWTNLNLNKDSLERLNNGIKYPVVFSMSCYTGNYAHEDCFAQHFCSMEGKGCVAIIAATCSSQWGATEILAMDMFDAIWPNSYFNPLFPYGNNASVSTPSPTYRLGQILNQGIYKMRMTWNYYEIYTCRIYHCFGDPSLRIYTQQPTSFENATITRSDGVISVNAGESNAEISFYNMTTGEVVRRNALQSTYICGTDTVSVCISGPNKIPYIDPLFLQNEVINGPVEYNGGNVKIGYSVTDQVSHGNVSFQSGDITIKACDVELQPGTTVELGTGLRIETR